MIISMSIHIVLWPFPWLMLRMYSILEFDAQRKQFCIWIWRQLQSQPVISLLFSLLFRRFSFPLPKDQDSLQSKYKKAKVSNLATTLHVHHAQALHIYKQRKRALYLLPWNSHPLHFLDFRLFNFMQPALQPLFEASYPHSMQNIYLHLPCSTLEKLWISTDT